MNQCRVDIRVATYLHVPKFIILLRAGLQNVRLKPVCRAKKFANPWCNSREVNHSPLTR